MVNIHSELVFLGDGEGGETVHLDELNCFYKL